MAKRTGPGRALPVKQVPAAAKKARMSPTQKAVNELVSLGADQEQLLNDLDNILLNPPPKHRYFLYGKEYKAAKRFPSRIESFANEIKNVNTGSLFYHLLLASRNHAKAGRKDSWVLGNDYQWAMLLFQWLPTVLSAYGEFVGFAVRQKKRRPWVRTYHVIGLIDHVKCATRKPHYAKIAALLEAAFEERGEDSPYDTRKLEDLYRKTRDHLLPLLLSPNDIE